jgi:hypothetical protein
VDFLSIRTLLEILLLTRQALPREPKPAPDGPPLDQDDAQKERAVLGWLAEYTSGREEIQSRSERQWLLVQIHAAASAAIIGFASISMDGRWYALLAVLAGALVAYVVFMDHHRVILRLADYQRTIIKPAVEKLTGDDSILGWENRPRRPGDRRHAAIFMAAVHIFIAGPAAVAIGLLVRHHDLIAETRDLLASS